MAAWQEFVVGEQVVVWQGLMPMFEATVTFADRTTVGIHTGDVFDEKGVDRQGRGLRIALADDVSLAYLDRARDEAAVLEMARVVGNMHRTQIAAIHPKHLAPLKDALCAVLGSGYLEDLADVSDAEGPRAPTHMRLRWLLRP